MEQAANQGRAWTASYYYGTAKEGFYMFAIGYMELLSSIFGLQSSGRSKHLLSDQNLASKKVSAGQGGSLTSSSQQNLKQPFLTIIDGTELKDTFHLTATDADKEPTTLNYGFGLLSRMLAAVGLLGPAFVLDLRPGLAPTRRFIITNYLLYLFWFFSAWFIAHIFIDFSLSSVIPKLSKNLVKLVSSSAQLSGIGYLLFGILSCSYLLYQRAFLHDFILYKSSFLSLSKAYQRRQMVTLFLTLTIFAFLAEPVFALVSILLDIQQPQVWPLLSSTAFILTKILICLLTATGANLISTGSIIIPLMTCYLIMSSTKHLKNLLERQSFRYKRLGTPSSFSEASTGRWKHNEQLEDLTDDRTRRVIKDYACGTLTMDWPDFTVAMEHQEPQATSLDMDVCSTNSQAASLGEQRMLLMQLTRAHGNFSSSAGSLLFMYKNLIKNLSELQGMILAYEQTFGSFHQVSTLVNCLIISQWVTVALTEMRKDTSTAINGGMASEAGARVSADIPLYVLRIGGGVLTFIVSNIFIFLKCDCLRDQLAKIRSQLFRMNIDLACEALETQRASWPPSGSFSGLLRTPSPPPVAEPCRPSSSELIICNQQENIRRALSLSRRTYICGEIKMQQADEWPELEQIWSLYEEFERLSLKANFRFSSEVYYSKRCLVLIFGRSISLILFFIQIIDVYSFA